MQTLLARAWNESLEPDGACVLAVSYVQERTLAMLRLQCLKTNAIVEGPLSVALDCAVVINGIPLKMKAIEALFLHVLVLHALGSRNGVRNQASFLLMPDILESIKETRKRTGVFAASNLTKVDLYNAVESLRKKLKQKLLDAYLIEGRRGQGYRLSTPQWQIRVGLSRAALESGDT